MRIASLVPSSTEMLFALGLGDSVVAVAHECDCRTVRVGRHGAEETETLRAFTRDEAEEIIRRL